MQEIEIQSILARAKRANDELNALCRGSRKLTMCVPVQDTDSDIVIGLALCDIDRLVGGVRKYYAALQEINNLLVTEQAFDLLTDDEAKALEIARAALDITPPTDPAVPSE